jgi:hypothetical protein
VNAPFCELAHGGAELRHHPAHVKPAQVAAAGALEPGSFDFSSAASFAKAPASFFSFAMMSLASDFFFDQDVARLVFAAGDGGLDALVLGLQGGFAHRVVLQVVLHVGVGQDRLPHQVELLGHLGRLVQALLDRLLRRSPSASTAGRGWPGASSGLSGWPCARALLDEQVQAALADGLCR